MADDERNAADAEILRLRRAVEDWHDRAVTAERALASLQDRYERVANERKSLSDTLQAIIDRVQSLQPVVLAAMAAHKPPNAKVSGAPKVSPSEQRERLDRLVRRGRYRSVLRA